MTVGLTKSLRAILPSILSTFFHDKAIKSTCSMVNTYGRKANSNCYAAYLGFALSQIMSILTYKKLCQHQLNRVISLYVNISKC